jgi:hypothetical protein
MRLKLNTSVKIENNVLVATMDLFIDKHYLCTVTLHNTNIVDITFPLSLPKTCGGGVEMVSFTDKLETNGLTPCNLYQLYINSIERYWETSEHRFTMLNYHLNKAHKYQS